VHASPPRPFGHLTAFVCGHHALHVGSQLAMGRISKGMRQEHNATASLFQRFQ
jgi:hypothetical protein